MRLRIPAIYSLLLPGWPASRGRLKTQRRRIFAFRTTTHLNPSFHFSMKPVVENEKAPPELRQPSHLKSASTRLRGHSSRHLYRPRFLSFAPLHLTILQVSFRLPPPPPSPPTITTLSSFPPSFLIFSITLKLPLSLPLLPSSTLRFFSSNASSVLLLFQILFRLL